MNDTEKRRKQLLERTKELYNDRYVPPAVHPRYAAFYKGLYEENDMNTQSTFGIRMFLCILLFAVFISMDRQGNKVMEVSSDRIVEEIMTDMSIEMIEGME